jgi:phosphoadenosine phosphosulfate reductase
VHTDYIREKIEGYLSQGKRVFAGSSFQTHSIPLLHIISKIDRSIPIYFLNTGFHFPETIEFRDRIVEMLDLNLVDLKPDTPKIMQLGPDGKLLFTSDPDHCCYLNKTKPMEQVLMYYDVWINGVRAEQSAFRSEMKEEQVSKHDVIRYHPMINWTNKEILAYRKKYNLPEHPLEEKGYFSIGCEPCTRRLNLDADERESRWFGLNKTECGLNTDLANN